MDEAHGKRVKTFDNKQEEGKSEHLISTRSVFGAIRLAAKLQHHYPLKRSAPDSRRVDDD